MGHEWVRELLRKKRTLEILDLVATHHSLNYSEIEDQIPTSSDVVADRLRTLVDYSLIEREEHSAKDVRYTISERGKELLRRVNDLDSFLES